MSLIAIDKTARVVKIIKFLTWFNLETHIVPPFCPIIFDAMALQVFCVIIINPTKRTVYRWLNSLSKIECFFVTACMQLLIFLRQASGWITIHLRVALTNGIKNHHYKKYIYATLWYARRQRMKREMRGEEEKRCEEGERKMNKVRKRKKRHKSQRWEKIINVKNNNYWCGFCTGTVISSHHHDHDTVRQTL